MSIYIFGYKRWYKEVDFASNLPPYFKDRLAENNFFILAVFFEPQLSRERIMSTKYSTLLGIVDDTFDRYASLPEAQSLANSLERYTRYDILKFTYKHDHDGDDHDVDEWMMMMYRWAPDHAMDKQRPGYFKFVLNFILETFEEFERELRPEGNPCSVKANIEEVIM